MNRIIKGTKTMHSSSDVVAEITAVREGKSTWSEIEGLTSSHAKAIAEIGCDFAAAGRLDEARVVFEGLVAMNPKDAAAHAALGTVYQKLGRLQDAVTEYGEAIRGDPKNPIALANRGELRLKAGDKNGLADLAQAVQADPHGETAAGRRARTLVKAIAAMAITPSKPSPPVKPAAPKVKASR